MVSWNKGLTKETDSRIKKQSQALSEALTGISNIERYGKEKAKEISKKQSVSQKAYIKKNPEITSKRTNHFIGKKHKPETIIKMRQAAVKRVLLNNGKFPSYNKKACEFFKEFDFRNCTNGQYAVYGGGEYYIKELGYFLDYINFEWKKIVEWDEKHHFNKSGNLRKKDKIRQKEIQAHFPDFDFERIKEIK